MALPTQYPQLGSAPNGALAGIMGADQHMNAMQNNQLNQMFAQSQEQRTAQEHPLNMQNKQLTNRQIELGLPGVMAQSTLTENKAKRDTATNDDQIKQMRSELVTKMSDDEIKQHENSVRVLMLHPSQQMRLLGNTLAEQLMEIKKLRVGGEMDKDRAIAVANIQKESAAGVAKTQAESRIAAVTAKNSPQNIMDQIKGGKLSMDRALAMSTMLGELSGNPNEQAQYNALSARLEEMIQKQKQAGAQAVPQVNPAVAPGVLVPPSLPGVTPSKGAPQPGTQKKMKMSDMKARYPNATDAQIRDAAAKKGITLE